MPARPARSDSDSAFVRRTIVTLTDAQIKAVHSAPPQIVASPGVGMAILFLAAMIVVYRPDGSYVATGDDGFDLAYGSGGGYLAAAVGPSGLFTGGPTRQLAQLRPYNGGAGGAAEVVDEARIVNLPLLLLTYSTADLTGGGAGNTTTVSVSYIAVDI